MVGVGPAFAPECRVVRDRTERPQDEHGAMRPAPVYPKCAYGHSATGPRVMNTAFHFVSGRVFSAPRTSPARAFFRAPIDVRGLRTFARQFPRGCLFSARIGCTCARTWGTCGLFPHSEEQQFSRGSIRRFLPIPSKQLDWLLLVYQTRATVVVQQYVVNFVQVLHVGANQVNLRCRR